MTDNSTSIKNTDHEIFTNISIPMLILNVTNGEIINANHAACEYYGYTLEEILRLNISDINTLGKKEILQHINDAKTEYKKYRRFKHRLANNEVRDVEVYSTFIKIKDDEILVSAIHDINEKNEFEKKYIQNKAHFDSLFNNSPEAIAIVDREFRILNINDKFEELFQYELKEVNNKDITDVLCCPFSADTSYAFRDATLKGNFVSKELQRHKKDGTVLDVLLMTFPLVIDGETDGLYCIYSDRTDSKNQEKEIEKLKYTDELTGLFNKKFLLNNLRNEIYKKEQNNAIEKLVVLVLKGNEIKEIYKVLGQKSGDDIVKDFSCRLKTSLDSKYILARLSKDEFGIMIPSLKEEKEVENLTNRILESLSSGFNTNKNDLIISTNIGIAIYPEDGKSNNALLRRAEIAMDQYEMESGNSLVQFENSYDKELQEYFWIKRDLLKATEKNQLFLNYQGIFDVSKNKLIGLEALTRWNHPKKGIIPPLKFIPIAEKTGSIHAIGEWVIMEACKQNKKWQDATYDPIKVSVNVSIIQLENPGFSAIVKKALMKSGLEAKYLQLEITETYFAEDYALIKEMISELTCIGVNFSIDDFGTGYSSLAQVCELEVTNLKIDKHFIDDVDRNSNKAKIVKAIISLADNLGISLIAEGVETKGELAFLKENGCIFIQGFIFSHAYPADEIEERFLIKY